MVKESLNETDFDRMYMNKIADASYRRIYKEVKNYCKKNIEESEFMLSRFDEEDENECYEDRATAQANLNMARDIMEILRNL